VNTLRAPSKDTGAAPSAGTPPGDRESHSEFTVPGTGTSDYTDGRLPGEWQSKFPKEARRRINAEAIILVVFFVFFCFTSGTLLGLSSQSGSLQLFGATVTVDFRLLAIFSVGCLGGTTFSIKWLVHSVARCKWHLDRCYWRFFVPLTGGVYARA